MPFRTNAFEKVDGLGDAPFDYVAGSESSGAIRIECRCGLLQISQRQKCRRRKTRSRRWRNRLMALLWDQPRDDRARLPDLAAQNRSTLPSLGTRQCLATLVTPFVMRDSSDAADERTDRKDQTTS